MFNKKFINFDVTEFTKLSEALPGVVIELELDVNLKKIDPSKLFGSGKIDDNKSIDYIIEIIFEKIYILRFS